MRMSHTRRLTVAIAIAGLLGSLITGVQPASAATNRPACITAQPSNCKPHRMTPAEVIQLWGHKAVGPGPNTYWGKIQFTKWTRHHRGTRTWWTATKRVTHPKPPPGFIRPDSWWDPSTWHWHKMFSGLVNAGVSAGVVALHTGEQVWDAIHKCVRGALTGYVGSLGGPLITDYLYWKSWISDEFLISRNPVGLAISATSGCVFGFSSR